MTASLSQTFWEDARSIEDLTYRLLNGENVPIPARVPKPHVDLHLPPQLVQLDNFLRHPNATPIATNTSTNSARTVAAPHTPTKTASFSTPTKHGLHHAASSATLRASPLNASRTGVNAKTPESSMKKPKYGSSASLKQNVDKQINALTSCASLPTYSPMNVPTAPPATLSPNTSGTNLQGSKSKMNGAHNASYTSSKKTEAIVQVTQKNLISSNNGHNAMIHSTHGTEDTLKSSLPSSSHSSFTSVVPSHAPILTTSSSISTYDFGAELQTIRSPMMEQIRKAPRLEYTSPRTQAPQPQPQSKSTQQQNEIHSIVAATTEEMISKSNTSNASILPSTARHPDSNPTHISCPPIPKWDIETIPPNSALIGSRREKYEPTLKRLANQKVVDPDFIFGGRNFEVPLEDIFKDFKNVALQMGPDPRGKSGDWFADHFDTEEEYEYKIAAKMLHICPTTRAYE